MGLPFSSIIKKKFTYETLEHLECQIRILDNVKVSTERRKRNIVRLLIMYSSAIYMTLGTFVYIKLLPLAVTKREQFLLLLPFLTFPALMYGVKRSISWWYQRQMMKDVTKLNQLKQKKAKILEDVMENESYRVAMQILEKFGNPQQTRESEVTEKGDSEGAWRPSSLLRRGGVTGKQAALNSSLPVNSDTTITRPSNLNSSIQQRNLVPGAAVGQVETKKGKAAFRNETPFSLSRQAVQARGLSSVPAPTVCLPRPVLPRERGYLDKFVGFLVGDGPCNRYAMICQQCQSHNGMALKEEFLYIAYRCCYCHCWNPARKQRPLAPRLPDRPTSSTPSLSSDVSTVSSSFSSHVSSVVSTQCRVLGEVVKKKHL